MSRHDVEAAIERWAGKDLLSDELAERLRAEHADAIRDERRSFSQLAVAGTAAILLIIAGGTFLAWTWPSLDIGARSVVIGALGLAVQGLGLHVESTGRNRPVAYSLQTAGMGLLLVCYAYSEESWPDATPGGLVVGLLSLVTPLALAPLFIRRNAVMPAVATALGYAFLFLFLDRAAGLDEDVIVWVLDGVMVASVLALLFRLRRSGGEDADWELNAFVASLYVGFVLVFFTAAGPLGMDDAGVLALDLWWTMVTGLTLWGIHRAPPALQRAWYGRQLAPSMLIAIVLGFWTTLGLWDAPSLLAASVVGGLGGAGLWYALGTDTRGLALASCFAIVCAAWYFGVERASVLGAALALGFTAGLLFWASTRLGRDAADVRGGTGPASPPA